jgi:3-deoxy-D-manno-octulosonate 8-phosphate phosphatase (KDO 8-P phosphatase)
MSSPPLERPVPDALLARAAGVRLLCLDVDGVLTDGRLYYGPDGMEIKAFHAQDGAAMKALMEAGVELAIITGRRSEAVHRRAAELGVPFVYQGVADKAAVLAELTEKAGVAARDMAHAGDDLADLPLFDATGLAFAVADAHPAVRGKADYVTRLPGGRGAVREICDLILIAQGRWPR